MERVRGSATTTWTIARDNHFFGGAPRDPHPSFSVGRSVGRAPRQISVFPRERTKTEGGRENERRPRKIGHTRELREGERNKTTTLAAEYAGTTAKKEPIRTFVFTILLLIYEYVV
jgi:hypothetical protein